LAAGPLVRRVMDEHAAVVMGGLALVIVGGFVASKYLF
jgi:hypothetical protein